MSIYQRDAKFSAAMHTFSIHPSLYQCPGNWPITVALDGDVGQPHSIQGLCCILLRAAN